MAPLRMMPRSPLHRYGFALGVVVVTLIVRTLMAPLWETTAPFALFMLATVIAAWFAGPGPAALTAAAGILARIYFDSPTADNWLRVTSEEAVRLALFAGFAVGVTIILERMKADRRDLEASITAAGLELEARRRIESELIEARRRAEETNRLKDEFLAMVSHELRTPLNAILGWSALLRGGSLSPSRAEHALDVIHRNARTQADLVGDLLDVARNLTGQLHLAAAPVVLAPVVEAALAEGRDAAARRGLTLVAGIDPGELRVWGDPARLGMVVGKLLANAVKFTPSGGRVMVSLRRAGDQAEIVVADTGEGIPHEFLPYVFDRFTQAETGSTRSHGGLGLGLTIVRQVAELHRGVVTADSDGPGHGARFTLRLPLLAGAGPPDDQAPRSLRSAASRGSLASAAET